MTNKKSDDKKTHKKRKSSSPRKSRADTLMIENFVTLQKVLTTVAVKLDSLSEQTSKLLTLFEISAKTLAEKQGTQITGEDKAFLDKLDQLMEQNKLIAKGLSMMGEHVQNSPPQNQGYQPNYSPNMRPPNRPPYRE